MGSSVVLKIVLKWTLFWLAVVGGLNYILPLFGLDYEKGFLLCTLYFSFFAGLGIYHYRLKESLAHHLPFQHQFLLIAVLSVLALAFGLLVAQAFPISEEKIAHIRSTRVLFPLFNFGTWLTKLADITFQQVFIFALLKELQRETPLPKDKIIIVAGTAFAILHLPLLFLLGWHGLYFIVPSVFAGFLFTSLIMYLRRGIFYSYSLHLIFYVLLGMGLRYI